jgi:hypothetical protein
MVERQRAGHHDHVVLLFDAGQTQPEVFAGQLHVGDAQARQTRGGGLDEVGIDVDTAHGATEMSQASREITTARAHFQHLIERIDVQRLQQPGSQLGLFHHLPMTQRNQGVGIGQRAIGGRDEGFAGQGRHQVQHPLIQHRPGADLLFHHAAAGLFEIHHVSLPCNVQ